MSTILDAALLDGFLEAARTGSIGAAARNLGRSQPLLTNHIRRLEDVVGCQLFERTPRGVSLTPEGKEFLPFAQSIVAMSEDARRIVGRRGRRPVGRIRVRLSEDLVGEDLFIALLCMTPVAGSLDLEILPPGEEPSPQSFENGEVDIFFGDPSQKLSAIFKPVKTVKTRLIWAASPKFDPKFRPVPLAVYPIACAWRARIAETLDRASVEWFVAVESGSLAALQSAARSGRALIACLTPTLCEGIVELDHRLHDLPVPPEIEIAQYRSLNRGSTPELEALERQIWKLIGGGDL